MTSYACRSVVGCSTDEDVVIIGVCGNGQAASFDLRVVHLAVVVAVSRLFSHLFFACATLREWLVRAGSWHAYDEILAH